ncbi:hypothetical protein U1Q18_000486, partial [Sarracenia purpurea var. burkii]
RRKVSEELVSKPTDSLVKTSDSSKNEESQSVSSSQGDNKLIFKSSTVQVSVVRKPHLAPNKPAKPEDKQEELEHKADFTSGGLQSLCQNYGSDEDD